MIPARKAIRAILGLTFAVTVALLPARAQQDSTPAPAKDDQPKPAATSNPWTPNGPARDDADVQPAPAGPPNPYGGAIKDAGTGLPVLGMSNTPLRWGSFSINTFEYIGIHDEFEPAGAPGTLTTNLSILRTGLMFDHYLLRNKSRIVLHYLPQMAISGGQVHANASANNNVSIGTKFELTPRLSVTVQDGFLQVHSNPLIPQNFLAVEGKSGSLVQNNFLETNGSFISDTASAVFEYALSPRTNVTASPLYRYARAIGIAPATGETGQTYAGVVTLGHAFSPHRTLGVTESYEYLRLAALGAPQTAVYSTTGLFYSEQLARTFWVTVNAGAVNQSFSDLQQANRWGFNGGFSLIKNFSTRVGLALAYKRGITFNDYVTRQRGDRVDGSLGFTVTSRISMNNSFGYFRELGGDPRVNGKYTATDLVYRFHGNFNLFTTFSYTFQNSSTPQILSGDRRTLAFGIRWSPPMLFPK